LVGEEEEEADRLEKGLEPWDWRAGTLDWSSRDLSPLEDSRCRRPPALSFSLYF